MKRSFKRVWGRKGEVTTAAFRGRPVAADLPIRGRGGAEACSEVTPWVYGSWGQDGAKQAGRPPLVHEEEGRRPRFKNKHKPQNKHC